MATASLARGRSKPCASSRSEGVAGCSGSRSPRRTTSGARSSRTSRSRSTPTRSRRMRVASRSRSTTPGPRPSATGSRPTRLNTTRLTPSASNSCICPCRRRGRRRQRTPTTRRCSRPARATPLDPSQRRYKLNIRNRSDYNIDAGTGTITPTRTTDEDWQINLRPPGRQRHQQRLRPELPQRLGRQRIAPVRRRPARPSRTSTIRSSRPA